MKKAMISSPVLPVPHRAMPEGRLWTLSRTRPELEMLRERNGRSRGSPAQSRLATALLNLASRKRLPPRLLCLPPRRARDIYSYKTNVKFHHHRTRHIIPHDRIVYLFFLLYNFLALLSYCTPFPVIIMATLQAYSPPSLFGLCCSPVTLSDKKLFDRLFRLILVHVCRHQNLSCPYPGAYTFHTPGLRVLQSV